jgi:hypothetical protein
MPKSDRIIDPVAAGAGYCHCGYHLPPGRAIPTAVWVAVHRAHHLAFLQPHSIKEWHDLADARQTAIAALEDECRRLRGHIADRDDVIEALEADLDFERRQASP